MAKVSWAFEGGTKPLWYQQSDDDPYADDADDGLNLNIDLEGVKATLDVLEVYECDVGFRLHPDGDGDCGGTRDILRNKDASHATRRWSDLVQDLVSTSACPSP